MNASATGTLKLVYHTAKVRLGFLIMACALTGVAVTPGHSLSAIQVLVLGIATLLASSAAGAFNQFYEHDLDARMSRTRSRPFVTGRFRANGLWAGGILLALLLAVAAATVATNWLAAFFVFLGAFTYGVVYTVWLKRRTWLNIVIGGLAGSFAILAGSAAAGATASPVALILAAVLFFWTPPHFWALAFACKADYQAAGVPMLPCVVSESASAAIILVHAVAVVILSIAPVFYGLGYIYLAAAVSGGGFFVYACARLMQQPSITAAWRAFAASIVQLGLLLTGAILDSLLLG
ncbi:MAG: heme o synthase [Gammaproteobacteria bacterium]|nr:heme o synthase [Gammaproteobacteria bacterium]